MQFNTQRARRYLQQFDFVPLFIEELGWDHHRASLTVVVDDAVYALQAIAQKRGMVVFVHWANAGIPPTNIRNKIERQIAQNHREHILLFVDGARTQQKWMWVRREMGRPLARRTIDYAPQRQPGELLLQKLQAIAFSLAEEENLTLVDVTSRVRAAFNVERATKKFYDQFKKERGVFEQFVQGIPDVDMNKWYVSVMLNRLMFVYFIQRKGFLDDDRDYLRHRLQLMQQRYGQDQFYSFYRTFLLRLFHEGLGEPNHNVELQQLIGKVPYLNGGIFQLHQVEQAYPNIQISDDAFARIFDFFDQYQWHLDDRPLRDDREINPDVLGYIFEKYINQKQMGAYYTKEDITEYISKNTIIPFLFTAARQDCAIAFAADGPIWTLPQADPDRYIYAAVRHGATHPLPPQIAAGIDDVAQRGLWNTPTPEPFALPTEIWRETVARRQRHAEVRAKLAAGEVMEINDFITYNLDIQQLAQDVIENSEGADLLSAFWKALTQVSVLDPTCGSGAFLFAALNILQPLYEAALDRMHAFMAEPEWVKLHPRYAERFDRVLANVDRHPNLSYFILKSIVVNNLYGVDIMPEAVEIAKLRLFLKLTAQVERVEEIEPLPDIDFNIRAGNTLVGFTAREEVRRAMQARQMGSGVQQGRLLFGEDEAALAAIEEKAADVDRLFTTFRQMQTEGELAAFDAADFVTTKRALEARQRALEAELNRHLARQYGVDPDKPQAYQKWLDSHQPFHWFTEFYGILRKGGFDVVIGNPPYVEYGKVRRDYTVQEYDSESCGNLYAYVIERNDSLIAIRGRSGMIIPHSSICTDRMNFLTKYFGGRNRTWVSTYDIRPSKLFVGVDQRLAVYLVEHAKATQILSSKYYRWYEDYRDHLFNMVEYIDVTKITFQNSIPKVSTRVEEGIWNKLKKRTPLRTGYSNRLSQHIVYFHNAPRYWVRAMSFAPYFWNERDGEKLSTQVKLLQFDSQETALAVVAILNSSLFFWWFIVLSDCRHLNLREIDNYPIGISALYPKQRAKLSELAIALMTDFQKNSRRKEAQYQATGRVIYDEYYPRLSKPIIDEVDRVLAQHYGFTDEELDFIINYDIKYRLGNDLFEEEEEA